MQNHSLVLHADNFTDYNDTPHLLVKAGALNTCIAKFTKLSLFVFKHVHYL